MKTIKLTIHYDGSRFHGWQRQSQKRSVQGTIEKTLSRILKTQIMIHGASRTDSGVHSTGQVASFQYELPMPLKQLQKAMNNELSDDVCIVNIAYAEDDFHARYSACGKTYHYQVDQGPYKNVFRSKYAYYYPYDLDLDKLKLICQKLKGTHDFGSFKAAGSSAQNPVRTITELDFFETSTGFTFVFTGDGFLYKMVRLMMGYILNVASGRKSIDTLSEVLETPSRLHTNIVAPAEGLCLKEVYYEIIEKHNKNLDFDS